MEVLKRRIRNRKQPLPLTNENGKEPNRENQEESKKIQNKL